VYSCSAVWYYTFMVLSSCSGTWMVPQLEYASSVWAPHIQNKINKLESVQRRSTRFATGNYNTTSSVTTMLNHLNWDTLQQRRLRTKAIMMYRIINGLVAIEPPPPFWRIPGPRLLLWPLVVGSITGLWMERRTLCVQLFCCMVLYIYAVVLL
jgi:hypothetical protein